MRKTFVSVDPLLKALSLHYGLTRDIRLVSFKVKFLEHDCRYHRHATKSENGRHIINKTIIILKIWKNKKKSKNKWTEMPAL